MKLIVHVTKDNLSMEEATELYNEIKECLAEKFPKDESFQDVTPYLHVNGQVIDKFIGSHTEGHIVPGGI